MNREELFDILDGAHISVARRPEGLRNGANVETLPPRLWERLLLQLQAEYRRATGETNAVLVVRKSRRRPVNNG